MVSARDRFDGHILGVGTSSGRRFVVGVWERSPFGTFADVMVAHPDGRREFLAPSPVVAEYVFQTYQFDAVTIAQVEVQAPASGPTGEWRVVVGASTEGGGGGAPRLDLTMTVGRRAPLGHPLRLVRGPIVHPVTARVINPFARVVMPGVRTAGSAGNGRREFYLAQDLDRVEHVTGTWVGEDVGALADVHPEPRFGFSSTPRRPTCTTVTTFIDRPT